MSTIPNAKLIRMYGLVTLTLETKGAMPEFVKHHPKYKKMKRLVAELDFPETTDKFIIGQWQKFLDKL